jgi:ABC-2 type transport system ATP-binding protein
LTETVIKLENICKRFGKFLAVNNISLEINRGEIIGFVGPNGAGKTTTLKLIARLMTPNSGKIFVINKQGKLQNLSENPKNLVEMGFLIDIPHFYNSTPYLVLKYIANIRNYPKEKLDQRINHLLTTFNLAQWKYKKVKHFSKGMIQKLGFIAAIIHDPEIIILDEPQTGLDPNARIDVRKYMRFLQNQGKTIFVASHMLYEISEVCDKIALINQGSIITFDALDNIEYLLKTKEIVCEILKPIPPEEKDLLLTRLIQSLEPYLEKNLDPSISKKPILYNPQEKSFIIYYDGKEDSRANILDILVNEFKSDFTINSFSKPKTSQLERLYTQMIRNNEFKAKLNRK